MNEMIYDNYDKSNKIPRPKPKKRERNPKNPFKTKTNLKSKIPVVTRQSENSKADILKSILHARKL